MGDLDRSLIKEFALVPAFYNKASPHFKDKAFIEAAWTEISTKLGYDGKKKKLFFFKITNSLRFIELRI